MWESKVEILKDLEKQPIGRACPEAENCAQGKN